MWIGLLTAGAHPSRVAGDDEVVTLFAWGRTERLRIDGPPAALIDGLRSVRRHAPGALGEPYDPRCFACREPYPVPFPDVIRARADAGDVDALDPVDGDLAVPASDPAVVSPADDRQRAVFLLVHLDDDTPVGDEGEALVVAAGTSRALLVPFDAMDRVIGGVVGVLAAEPLAVCWRCGCPVPGGAIGTQAAAGAPNRSQRRREARRIAGRRHAT